jgi:hypothetical protein
MMRDNRVSSRIGLGPRVIARNEPLKFPHWIAFNVHQKQLRKEQAARKRQLFEKLSDLLTT